jgi:hypothetical protein
MIATLARFFPVCIILLGCFSGQGLAQSANAFAAVSTLSGAVNDASGVAVPFAKITVKNLATGAASQAQANSTGAFSIASLPPGDYEVTASAEGFTAATTTVALAGSPQTVTLALTSAANGPSLSDLGFSPAQTQGNAADQARLDKRSHMLRTHQRLGLITTAPLLTTVILGFGAGGKQTSTTTRDVHAALGTATVGLYGATAYYAIFAPKIPGTETRGPIRAHKILAWIHGPGMVLTPILGEMAFAQKSKGEKIHGIASLHSPVAVITAGAYGASILSVSLKW